MTHLTREQLAAIHAAKRAGLTKKELFEMEVQGERFEKLPPEEKARHLASVQTQEGAREAFIRKKRKFPTITPDKLLAVQELNKTNARVAFIRKKRGMTKQELEMLK